MLFPCFSSYVVVSNAGTDARSGCGMLRAPGHREEFGPAVVSRPMAIPPLAMKISKPNANWCEYKTAR